MSDDSHDGEEDETSQEGISSAGFFTDGHEILFGHLGIFYLDDFLLSLAASSPPYGLLGESNPLAIRYLLLYHHRHEPSFFRTTR